MIEILVNNLEIFFMIIMSMLYIAFIFFTENTTSKSLIFFISSFINIFNYSFVLKNEYNFLTMVLLNIIFVLIVAFFYVYSDTSNNSLSADFIEDNDIKNFIVIIIFAVSLFVLCFIFLKYNSKKEFFSKNFSNKILIDSTTNYKVDNLVQKKEIILIGGHNYIIYTRKIRFIEENNMFSNYNLIVILYVVVSIISFFITNKGKTDEG
jgi:hypothetical protein